MPGKPVVLASSTPCVAIGAANFALRYFFQNCGPASGNHVADVGYFFSNYMIELKNFGVSFAAIDARVFEEIRPEALLILATKLMTSPMYIRSSLGISRVVGSIPLSKTVQAPSPSSESFCGKIAFASSATSAMKAQYFETHVSSIND